jgi:sulfite reductase beta subunit-like hemoprotein
MRYHVQELGPEGFREELEMRTALELTPAGESLPSIIGATTWA